MIDTYGHAFGDFVLCEFAKRIKKSIRKADIAFRYGGEEFVLLLPQTALSEATLVGKKIIDMCQKVPFKDGEISYVNTVSVGGSSVSESNCVEPGELLVLADKMLYKAKGEGRNRIAIK